MQPDIEPVINYYRVEYLEKRKGMPKQEETILIKVIDGNLGDAYRSAREYLTQKDSIGQEITGIFKTEIETEDIVVNGEYADNDQTS